MSEDDLIRRGDALMVCGTINRNDEAKIVDGILRALPAVAPAVRVKPLVWELQAGQGGPYYSAFDPLYGRVVEAPDEDTCDAIDSDRTARILAALPADDRVAKLVEAAKAARIVLAEYEPHPLPVLNQLLVALAAWEAGTG